MTKTLAPGHRLIPHACHWGAFLAEVAGDRLVDVHPFPLDPAPSPLIRSWLDMARSPLRIARPHVRRGYLAGDGGAGRGRDSYQPLPWDEALDMAAAALAETRARHGNAALCGGSYGWASAGRIHHAKSALKRFLNAFGGCTGQWSNYSYGAADALMPHVVGAPEGMNGPVTDLAEVARHADLVLAFGGLPAKNWEMQSGGSGIHAYPGLMAALARGGAQIVTISPWQGDRPEGPEGGFGRWLPIRPGSDTALILAMIRQIDRDGRADEAFLARYTSGAARLRAYVAGADDGLERDAAWAEGLTGIPAEQIVALTRSLYGKATMLTATWSLQRAEGGEQPFWALIALAAMLGRIGLPGQGFAFGYGSMNGLGNPRYRTPVHGLPALPDPPGLPPIPVARITDMLLNPGGAYRFNGEDRRFPQARLIYWAGGNPFHHHQDLRRLSQGFRQVDHVIVQDPYWTATARHADLVLPATISLERNDYSGSSRDRFLLAMHQVLPPLDQARDDYDIFAALAERLGIGQAFTKGRSSGDWLRLAWARSQKALEQRGIAAPDFDTFWAAGHFELPEPPPHTQFADFRADPQAAPLATPSGRIMLENPAVGDGVGHAHWRAPSQFLGSDLARRHRFHLLSPQPARRLHGQMEASQISASEKIAGREKLRISLGDAAALGLARGDLVDIWNETGACIAAAWPEEGLIAGVVLLPTGAAYDPDAQGHDRNSNPNVLIADRGTSVIGQGSAAQSCLVSIRRRSQPAPALAAHAPPKGAFTAPETAGAAADEARPWPL